MLVRIDLCVLSGYISTPSSTLSAHRNPDWVLPEKNLGGDPDLESPTQALPFHRTAFFSFVLFSFVGSWGFRWGRFRVGHHDSRDGSGFGSCVGFGC
jgi:hypothetical protein